MSHQTTVLCEDFHFGEGPRWHQGRLWFSDFYDQAVRSVDLAGTMRTEVTLDDQPSGLGWLPDGRLLLVSMRKLKVMRQDPDGLKVHADLSAYAKYMCNDMVVDARGRAYVGNFGFDLDTEMASRGAESVLAQHPSTNLVRVDVDGSVHLASDDMHFPNGSVISPDGKTLIIAESLGLRLTAFDIAGDGSLSNRRLWAEVGFRAPDGIAQDTQGNVWVANALANECVLIAEGGEVLAEVKTSQKCFACALGGADGRQLFMLTAVDSHHALASAQRSGKVEVATVAVPAAVF